MDINMVSVVAYLTPIGLLISLASGGRRFSSTVRWNLNNALVLDIFGLLSFIPIIGLPWAAFILCCTIKCLWEILNEDYEDEPYIPILSNIHILNREDFPQKEKKTENEKEFAYCESHNANDSEGIESVEKSVLNSNIKEKDNNKKKKTTKILGITGIISSVLGILFSCFICAGVIPSIIGLILGILSVSISSMCGVKNIHGYIAIALGILSVCLHIILFILRFKLGIAIYEFFDSIEYYILRMILRPIINHIYNLLIIK